MTAARRVLRVTASLLVACATLGGLASAQIDLTGEWAVLIHEDIGRRVDNPFLAPGIPGAEGPRIGDYLGFPINDAARRRADSWDASIKELPEHQLEPNSLAYYVQIPSNLRISKIVDAASQQLTGLDLYRYPVGITERTIWTDGRPHPPEYAAHTWTGFSTGTWDGDMLTVRTTHLKAGFIERNGLPASDAMTVVEHLVRHGDVLTIISIVSDPIYLDEPLVRSESWARNATLHADTPLPAFVDDFPDVKVGNVPHHLPGTNLFLREFSDRTTLPFEVTRGGREQMYPEYQRVLKELMAGHPTDPAKGK